jgi:hypothetical protein
VRFAALLASSVATADAAENVVTATTRKKRKKMPQLNFSQALTANQLGFNPISGWQFEYLPWPAQVILLVRATDNNERMTVYSGSETIMERSNVQGGGTAGVTPSELNTPAVSWIAAAGDRLKVVIDNTTAGTPTVDGIIIANPA